MVLVPILLKNALDAVPFEQHFVRAGAILSGLIPPVGPSGATCVCPVMFGAAVCVRSQCVCLVCVLLLAPCTGVVCIIQGSLSDTDTNKDAPTLTSATLLC